MATILEPDNDLTGDKFEVNELDSIKEDTPAKQEIPALPEKYRGKSVEEIIRMHEEAEKKASRHANELGEVRKLADGLIAEKLSQKQQAATVTQKEEPVDEVDFFVNPKEAVQKIVKSSLEEVTAPLKQQQAERVREETMKALQKDYPEHIQWLQDDSFAEYLKSNPVLIEQFQRLNNNYDLNAGRLVFDGFKAIQERRKDIVKKGTEDLKADNKAALKSVKTTAGTDVDAQPKVYRRSDIRNLMIRDPDRYEQLEPEIMRAYAEGRVR